MRALAAAAVLLLAGCGASAGDSERADPGLLSTAAERTLDAGSMRLAFSGTGRAAGTALALSFRGTGAFDRPGGRVETTGRVRAATATGQAELSARMILDGHVAYLNAPGVGQGVPGRTRWLRIDLERAGERAGVDLETLFALGEWTDPRETLAYLDAAGPPVRTGYDRIRGAFTTRYRTAVDLEAYARQREQRGERDAPLIREVMEDTGQRRLPMSVWLDDERRVRRMRWTQWKPVLPGRPATITTTIDLFDFGRRVRVRVPRASEVTDVTDDLEALGAR